jgi:Protein of unknown function (DUF2924)
MKIDSDSQEEDIRAQWAKLWGRPPSRAVGRTLLKKSIDYYKRRQESDVIKQWERELDSLVKEYKRNPRHLDEKCENLKPGARIVREWNGKKYCVLVKADGFEYQDRLYRSLSQIANEITGSHWNGQAFFGLRD